MILTHDSSTYRQHEPGHRHHRLITLKRMKRMKRKTETHHAPIHPTKVSCGKEHVVVSLRREHVDEAGLPHRSRGTHAHTTLSRARALSLTHSLSHTHTHTHTHTHRLSRLNESSHQLRTQQQTTSCISPLCRRSGQGRRKRGTRVPRGGSTV